MHVGCQLSSKAGHARGRKMRRNQPKSPSGMHSLCGNLSSFFSAEAAATRRTFLWQASSKGAGSYSSPAYSLSYPELSPSQYQVQPIPSCNPAHVSSTYTSCGTWGAAHSYGLPWLNGWKHFTHKKCAQFKKLNNGKEQELLAFLFTHTLKISEIISCWNIKTDSSSSSGAGGLTC